MKNKKLWIALVGSLVLVLITATSVLADGQPLGPSVLAELNPPPPDWYTCYATGKWL